MARKTTGTTTTARSKKSVTPAPPVTEQSAAPVQKEIQREVSKSVSQEIVAQGARAEVRPVAGKEVTKEVTTEVRKNGKTANAVAAKVPAASAPAAIEEQIRLRAYELYLERRATAGMANGDGYSYGDENQDWLIAEREIRSRQENQGHHSA